jgi:alginate O-acetyltransferase complex protein AlgJ
MILREGRRGPAFETVVLAWMAALCALTCHPGGAAFPWPKAEGRVAAEHADVKTLNQEYQRTRSQVLVREVSRPTRAALDYAAYHANFMIADPPPDSVPPPGRPDTSHPFNGAIERDTLTGDIGRTPLTMDERRHPLAFAPMVQFLEARKVAGADGLEELGSAVRGESWGARAEQATPTQQISEAYLHKPASGATEMWVKIEFVPWFTPFRDMPDQDGDGFAEVYGRVRRDRAEAPLVDELAREYVGHVLDRAEIKAWANKLASYWYPSFNTDLVPPGATFPDARTEDDIKRELGGRVFATPAIVLRGKPQGKPTYEVFLLKDCAQPSGCGDSTASVGGSAVLHLPKSVPTPDPRPVGDVIEHELATQAEGSWTAWATQLNSFQDTVRRRLRAAPPKIKALAGIDGFLFYRHSLEFAVGGDLEKQRAGKNPLPVVVEFKKRLEASGVDFLFVPVPTKLDVFPDKLDPSLGAWVGRVVNPWARKFLLDLARQGVEVVDLLPPLLAARAAGESAGQEPLFQRQDTHWTDRGLRLAADIVAARIKKYPWYAALAQHGTSFGLADTTFTRFGDLHSRLPEAQKPKYKPETLAAHRVTRADGSPYEDDADSPIVVLGDSFTGVYELTDAEHAGISAHIARGISYPVDLVMSYGGGPNVRQKLMRRGADALSSKKLVVWIMTARDLYDYWENWEPLPP